MSLAEYAVMFVLVTIMGAGIPGPGDASLIAASATLPAFVSGFFHVRFWLFLLGAPAAKHDWPSRTRPRVKPSGTDRGLPLQDSPFFT